MKGTLELCFPPVAPNLPTVSGKFPVLSRWLEHSPTLRSANHSGSFQRELRNSYFKRRVAFYSELIRKEWQVKSNGPFWQKFTPSRISLRLSSEWLDYAAMAEAVGNHILKQVVPRDLGEGASLIEMVISAHDIAEMTTLDSIKNSQVIVLSDLCSSSLVDDWKHAEKYAKFLQEHRSFGIELQASTWEHRGESFRRQLQAVSKLKPDFIRISQRRVKNDSCLFGHSANIPSRMRTLQIGLEAFQALDYEPVSFQSHQITLLPQEVVFSKSEADSFKTPEFAAPHCVLGLGAGGVSLRYDSQGRVITNRNPDNYSQYRNHVQKLWRLREGVTTGAYLPYIHQEIEKGFKQEGKLSYRSIEDRFGVNLEKIHPGLSRVLESAGLVKRQGDSISLTDHGRTLQADVARNFFITDQDLQYIQ